jgi:recombination protein RecA
MAKKKDDVEEVEESREDKLASLFHAARKKWGENVVGYAKDFKFKLIPRISSGVLPMDYALGGGFPVGRISMVYGHKSSAKTTLFLRAVGNAQKQCSSCWSLIKEREGSPVPKCECGENRKTVIAWLDVEGCWNDEWARNYCNPDEVILSQPDTAEQTIDLADSYVRSGVVDVIVIDSIAFMTAAVEIEKSATEQTMGVQARLIGVQMRKFVSGFNTLAQSDGRKPTVFLINQIRNKMVLWGSPDVVPGGLAQGFATSTEVHCYTNNKYDMDDITGKPITQELRFRIDKNKVGPARIEGEYKLILSNTETKKVGEVIDEGWALTMGEKAGLITIAGQTVTCNGQTYRGKSTLERFWTQNKKEYQEFKDKLLPVLLTL